VVVAVFTVEELVVLAALEVVVLVQGLLVLLGLLILVVAVVGAEEGLAVMVVQA